MHTSGQITALQQLLKDLAWLKAQKVGLVFKVADVWLCPSAKPSPAQDVPQWLLGQQPQTHQIGQEHPQHLLPFSPTLAINSGVFLLKPQQIIAAPYSLILDLCSKSSSNLIPVWCGRVIEFQLWHVSCARATIWCWGCFCVAAGEQMILDLILSLPGQNYPIKIFWANLKQHCELAPVLHLVVCGFSSFSGLLEAAKPS